jgi:hypothetical protein
MSAATGFSDFWRALTNDEVFICELLFKEVSGRKVIVMTANPADWPEFRETILALGKVVRLLNYAFALFGVTFDRDTGRFTGLDTVLEWAMANLETDRTVATPMVWLVRRIIYRSFDYPKQQSIEALFQLEFIEPTQRYLPAGTFDVFISYKRRDYLDQARRLRADLESRGVKCWLDQEQLKLRDGEWLDTLTLRQYLKYATQACRLTVFFETQAAASADEDFRGSTTAFNWQMFERRHAHQVVYVRPRRRIVDFGDTRPGYPFHSDHELADRIAAIAGPREGWTPSRGWRLGSDGTIRQASAELAKRLNEYFAREIALSARMALILLAPLGEDEYGGRHVVLADEVLVNLVRYSPFVALVLQASGIHVGKLLAVGVRFTRALWSPPRPLFVDDMFGMRKLSHDPAAPPQAIDEATVLTTLVGLALRGYAARDLLIGTLKYMNHGDHEKDYGALMRSAVAEISSLAGKRWRPCRTQQWILIAVADGVALYPFAEATAARIPELSRHEDHAFVVNLIQRHGVFDAGKLERLARQLTSGKATAIDAVVDEDDELGFALGDVDRAVATDVVFPVDARRSFGDVFLTDGVRSDAGARTGTIGEFLVTARAALGSLGETPAVGWRRQSAVILTSRDEEAATSIGELPRMTPFQLHYDILAVLHEYQALRQLDYDGHTPAD